ncbi:PRC and DUF2382 domain-containing protein [Geodermatophilus sp. CPCC 206100]|uniref:PRC and DUF2382 domain-containing protein n=1 Tax=Geodermatophilus sp. CPCC 206100 TaxID=3020054 RepID=UPI003B002FA0
MLSERELSAAIGSTAYGPDGEKIGTVEHFFTDDRTGAPTWVAVSTGLFGVRHSVVPAAEATFADGVVQLPVTKDAVKNAPSVSSEHLDPDDEALLRRHYGLGQSGGLEQDGGLTQGDRLEQGGGVVAQGGRLEQGSVAQGDVLAGGVGAGAADATTAVQPSGAHAGDTVRVEDIRPAQEDVRTDSTAAATAGAAAGAAARPPAPAADRAMTRSEEQLRVGAERVATTRARLVKYVITEEVTVTVPVRREEIRVEEVPIDAPDAGPGESLVDAGPTPAGRAVGGTDAGAAGGLPEEIVLHAERPVVSVEVVPVQRVRLRTEVVEGQEQISERLQREEIAVDEERRPGL